MNLFGFHIHITRQAAPAATKSASTPASLLWGDHFEGNPQVLTNAYQQVVWVYRAINALAEQVANIPFRFSTPSATGDQLITSGPLHAFYNRPHPHINRFQYWELRVIWLMLRGECFRIPIFEDAPTGLASGSPRPIRWG